ncbi:MAG: hypothetical protein MO853_10585 [Candidatus Protistobacter heckmanni]|nr:hypothetical protein [Candidatus Protistobacter heckmanni]
MVVRLWSGPNKDGQAALAAGVQGDAANAAENPSNPANPAGAAQRELAARVCEVSGAADPATCTFAVRTTIQNPPADLALGMTASVRLKADVKDATKDAKSGEATVLVPLTALLMDGAKTQVWIFDAASSTVKPVAVTLGHAVGNAVRVTSGLSSGQMVVAAGVHLLKLGMKVNPLAV